MHHTHHLQTTTLAGEAEWAVQYGLSYLYSATSKPTSDGLNFVGAEFNSDPAPTIGSLGQVTKYSTGSNSNGIIIASNVDGDPQWAVSLNSELSYVTSVAYVDGKLYAGGVFYTSVTIPGLASSLTTPNPGESGGFVFVMNATTGTATAGIAFPCTGTFGGTTVNANTNGAIVAGVRLWPSLQSSELAMTNRNQRSALKGAPNHSHPPSIPIPPHPTNI